MNPQIRDMFTPTPIINMIVQFEKFNIYSDTSMFREFIFDTDGLIRRSQSQFRNNIKGIQCKNDDERDHFESYCERGNEKYFQAYPKYIRHSTIITLYSYLENKVQKLVDNLSVYCKDSIKKELKEITSKRSELHKFKAFLEENFEISYKGSIWIKINQIRQIRNSIVHHNSVVKLKKYNAIRSFMEQDSDGFSIDDKTKEFRIINSSIVIDFTKTVESFLNETYKQVEEKLNK